VLASVGLQAGIIMGYAYQMTIAVIAVSLLLSPGWIALFKRLTKPHRQAAD
jgi:CPA2 family monovalent cation:H+ antiporter-2